ncbi:P-loop containing nucleoside triphosphate hydrolase protein [Cantharellus anzutake]|uniref:P-loop containing nucleoside triphosphate hydrolase protein n=1 Tax=Cantharellus anzutake TaxID=1750568 RepID=UPI001908A75E|nr:P-loop containing nucleoside triphosphate hydrolase protein [Cantharellus anzutake]KAF8327176.1 P-loop containing nucleoside triphosphate hydrolase protein [Cantharellus anzutake]
MAICGLGSSTSSPAPFGRRTIQRKVVIVGDGACGKTSLLNVFLNGFFPQVYEPTIFENHAHDVHVDDQTVELALWDTAGQEDFDRYGKSIKVFRSDKYVYYSLRSLSYPDSHVVMICFSVDNPISLENVETRWIEDVLEHCPGVKIVLVALKCDLRDDHNVQQKLARRGMHPCGYEEGLAIARRIRASRYMECSAKHNRGVREVFFEVARVSINAKPSSWDRRGTFASREKHDGCLVM